MARVIEIEGKTIDEALYHGLDQLALTIDEVDMEVLVPVKEGKLELGEFYDVRITDATEFDLMGILEK